MVEKAKLGEVIDRTLRTLRRENFNSIEDVVNRQSSSYGVDDRGQDVLSVIERSSDDGTIYVLRYIQKNEGIPVEIGLNPNKKKTKITIVCPDLKDDYNKVDEAIYHDIIQEKEINSINFNTIKSELRLVKSWASKSNNSYKADIS